MIKKISFKGFTLIEIIGVIVLLGIVVTISIPIINKSLNESKEKTFDETIKNLEEISYRYAMENKFTLGRISGQLTFTQLLDAGYIRNLPTNPSTNELLPGCIEFNWVNNKYEFVYSDTCVAPDTNVVFSDIDTSVWYNDNFFVPINISGGDGYSWCVSDSECIPVNSKTNGVSFSPRISTEGYNYICAVGYFETVRSEIVCNGPYKLDKTAPSFTGIADLTVVRNETVDLTIGVTAVDSLSGINANYTFNPSVIDTTIAGITNVTYSIEDIAGNTKNVTRKVIVDSASPSATFVALGDKINSNGWAKEDFYVSVTVLDKSGTGIKFAKWCSTTNDTCIPSVIMEGTSMTPLISTESNNNRICIQVFDNADNDSGIICSDAYKLDKTMPAAGSINYVGTMGSNNWYISDVNLTAINGIDSMSGHANTSIDISNITTNTTGTVVTLTTSDLAGNITTTNATVKVDKNTPTIVANEIVVEIDKGTSNDVSSYFIPTYGISGGIVNCNPINTNSLNVGLQNVSCTVTGNNGLSSSAIKNITVNSVEYVDNSGANIPKLTDKLTPVIYQNNNWVVADITQKWYDYDNKEWANAVILNNGVTKSPGDTLNLTNDVAAMFVWIPRYKYVIFNGNNEYVEPQEINIIFENGISKTGTVTCVDDYSVNTRSQICTDTANGSIINGTSTYTHPAFTLGTDELTGIWVAKFEMSAPSYNATTVQTITVKPDVQSWGSAKLSVFFTSVQNMATDYNLISIDSHVIKNMEWGSVAYLSTSRYGRCTSGTCTKISRNNSALYWTGRSDGMSGLGTDSFNKPGTYTYEVANGQLASTTGNIYGIYDMNGGSEEYAMGAMINSSGVPIVGSSTSFAGFNGLYSNGSTYTSGTDFPDYKYVDFYTYSTTNTAYSRYKLGDATREVLNEYEDGDHNAWYDAQTFMLYDLLVKNFWNTRGSSFSNGVTTSIFAMAAQNGAGALSRTTRPVLAVIE